MSEFEQQGRADYLESVLQTISVSRITGILHVERGKGGVRDGGDVVLLHGQVIDATSSSRRGPEALEWLLTWGNCQYTFQAKFPNEVLSSPSAPVSLPMTPVPPSPVPSPLRSSAELVTQNVLHFFGAGHTTEKDEPVSASGTKSSTPLPGICGSQTSSSGRYTLSDLLSSHASTFLAEVRVPARAQNGSAALALLERSRLSRLHRHVFLLLDGRRTVYDLVRITGHPLYEIERLLIDLERTGLIYW